MRFPASECSAVPITSPVAPALTAMAAARRAARAVRLSSGSAGALMPPPGVAPAR